MLHNAIVFSISHSFTFTIVFSNPTNKTIVYIIAKDEKIPHSPKKLGA